MIKPELLAILCCPESRQSLREAAPDFVERFNVRIAAGEVRNRGGEVIKEPIQSALIREDGKFAYLMRDDIPVMLIDQAAPLEA